MGEFFPGLSHGSHIYWFIMVGNHQSEIGCVLSFLWESFFPGFSHEITFTGSLWWEIIKVKLVVSCHFCGRAFSQDFHMKSHLLVHYGGKSSK